MHAAAKRTALQARIAIAILSLNALALSKNVISLIIADLIKTYPEYPVSTIQLIFSTTTGMAASSAFSVRRPVFLCCSCPVFSLASVWDSSPR